MSYPTLQDVKDYLGITDSTHDAQLTSLMAATQDLIENYCGRKFTLAEYTQSTYKPNSAMIQLDNYPVTDIVSIEIDSDVKDLDNYHLSIDTGSVYGLFNTGDAVDITYNGGYANLPPTIYNVFMSVFDDQYNDLILGTNSEISDVTIFDFAKVSYNSDSSSSGLQYSGVSSGNTPEPLANYVGMLDLYKSNTVLLNASGSR